MSPGDLRWLAKKAARRAVAGLGTRPSRRPTVRVLTYHRIQSRRRDPFALPASEFETQVAAIAASGRAIGLDHLLGFLDGTVPLGPDRLLLTIDDGYASTLEAAPILRRHGVPAVAFVTTSRIGTSGDGPERFLDEDEIRALPSFGIDVGSHAVHHQSLGRPIKAERLAEQTAGSKQRLEALLGRDVTTFAYPFGTKADHSPRSRAALAAAGYRACFTSRHGPVEPASDPLALPRIKIESGDPSWIFSRALSGGLDRWSLVDDSLARLQASGRS